MSLRTFALGLGGNALCSVEKHSLDITLNLVEHAVDKHLR